MQDDSLADRFLLQYLKQAGLQEKLETALRLGDDSPIVLQVDNCISTGAGTSQRVQLPKHSARTQVVCNGRLMPCRLHAAILSLA